MESPNLKFRYINPDEGNSLLMNTRPGNNFIFKVESKLNLPISDFNSSTYECKGGISEITCRLQKLEKLGAKIRFTNIQPYQLWKNLKMIDGDLPDILAFALLYRWRDRDNSLKGVANLLEQRDPLNYYNGQFSGQKLYEYKLKKLLVESAMGMRPDNPWLGEYDKFGGIIMAKGNGDILCFHTYDFNLVKEYLINNTKFEQAATSEDKQNPGNLEINPSKPYHYGWIYKEEDILKLKLNLQIRFS